MKRQEFLNEVRKMTAAQLAAKITASKKRLLELNQEKMLGKLKNFREIRVIKRAVARYSTVLDEKVTQSVKG